MVRNDQSQADKTDFVSWLADKLIAQLKEGTSPWQAFKPKCEGLVGRGKRSTSG
jgi:antirestriction protein ArdC